MLPDDTAKKILIIDDEQPLREILCNTLEKEGFTCVQAVNGKEGLSLAFQERPDVILLDVAMPVMDGIEMLKKLRQDAWGKQAKIIILTNFSGTQRVFEEFGIQESDYVVKASWKLEDIIKKIRGKLKS
ncbi:MAG: response regulator [bacterium]|nr:response regulator [bacterium]